MANTKQALDAWMKKYSAGGETSKPSAQNSARSNATADNTSGKPALNAWMEKYASAASASPVSTVKDIHYEVKSQSPDEMLRQAAQQRQEAAQLTAKVTGRRVGTGEMPGLMAQASALQKSADELTAKAKAARIAEKNAQKQAAGQTAAKAWAEDQEKYADYDIEAAKRRLADAEAEKQAAWQAGAEQRQEAARLLAVTGDLRRNRPATTRRGVSAGEPAVLDQVETLRRDAEQPYQKAGEKADALRGEIERAEYVQKWNQYNAVTERADFAARSTAAPNVEDKRYQYINDIGGTREYYKTPRASKGRHVGQKNNPYLELEEMTDTEVGIYNYLYATQGNGAAGEYLTFLRQDLNARAAAKQQEQAAEFGEEHPWIGSAASVPLNLLGGVVGAIDTAAQVVSGQKYDPYSRGQRLAASGQDIRGGVMENMTDAGRFVYQTVMSGVDSLTAGAVMPGAGAAGALLATGAGTQAAREIALRGGSNGQILAGGIAAGIFEALFESWSIGNFQALKEMPVNGIKDFALNVAKEAGVNFSEEALTEIANIAYDTMAMGDKSNRALRIQELAAGGMSLAEAERQADWELAMQVLEAGASGALMGAGFGAIGSAQSAYYNGRNTGAGAQQNTAPEGAAENTRLTQDDLDDYLAVGARKHVRDMKTNQIAAGQSPVLTSAREIAGFIRDALQGKIRDTIKGYGRVGARLAGDVAAKSNGAVQIDGYYLELDANHIRHISDHVGTDSDVRNIPLTEEQAAQLADYIDTYDDLLSVTRHKDGGVRLTIGKKINGHAVIIETVSSGRGALHPVTAYQMKTTEYERTYKTGTVADHNASYPEKSDQVDTSRQAVPANGILSSDAENVNGAPLFQSEADVSAGPLRNDAPSGDPRGLPVSDDSIPQGADFVNAAQASGGIMLPRAGETVTLPGNKNTAYRVAVEESTAVNDDPAQHTPEEQRVIEEYKDSADRTLAGFIQRVRGLKDQNYKNGVRTEITTQTDKAAKKAAELTGTDTTGYTTIINGSTVQHIDARHGENGTADHSMADLADFSRIGFVLDHFTNAELLDANKADQETVRLARGWRNGDNTLAPLVRYSMPVNGTYYVVEAVPSSKAHVMAVISAYMSGAKKDTTLNQVLKLPTAQAASVTSETPLELLGGDSQSIPQPAPVVNSAQASGGIMLPRAGETVTLPRAAQQNAAPAERAGRTRISMEEYANADAPIWNNVPHEDTETQTRLMQEKHGEMVGAGRVVIVPEETLETVDQAYPDLRSVKKTERLPLLKTKINQLKASLREVLNGLKGSYEFEINGKVLEARLYDTGVAEVMKRVTQPKANVLFSTGEIFQNAEYLYSTPDYDGNPNIYRWNYFYSPVQIGSDTVGVRIAVRDMANPSESQIYNWDIKKNAALGGAGRGQNRIPSGASSAASKVNIAQPAPVVNPAQTSGGIMLPRAGETVTLPRAAQQNAAPAERAAVNGGITLPTAQQGAGGGIMLPRAGQNNMNGGMNNGTELAGDHAAQSIRAEEDKNAVGEENTVHGGVAGRRLDDAGQGGADQLGGVRRGSQEHKELTARRQLAVVDQPWISAEELGIAGGTPTPTLRVLAEDDWDEELRTISEWAYDKGVRSIKTVVGRIEIETDAGAVGVEDVTNVQTGEMVVRTDSLKSSVTEIVRHAVGHMLATREKVQAFLDTVKGRDKAGAWQRVFGAYERRWAPLTNNYTGMSQREKELYVWEEILGDAYANRNSHGVRAGTYHNDALAALEGNTEAAYAPTTAGAGTAEAVAAPAGVRGPPKSGIMLPRAGEDVKGGIMLPRAGEQLQRYRAEDGTGSDMVKPERLTRADVDAIQSIGMRKSVNDFTGADLERTVSFARKTWLQLKEKSPFFRAWFGDWRVNDQTPVHIANRRGEERGVHRNEDTGWEIATSRIISTETKAHTKEQNVSARAYLPYINDIVKKAVLLDSFAMNAKKSINSLMMHSLYAVADIGNGPELLKLYVEEMADPNQNDTAKRAYQLQNIERQQLSAKGSGKALAQSISTADIHTVADLFAAVKAHDASFHPKLYVEEMADPNQSDTTKRAYQLQNIERQQSSVTGSGKALTVSISTADIHTVADLFAAVKAHDASFHPRPASKVVDEDGRPLVVYHGTDAEFEAFDRTKGRSTMDIQGSFFSPWEIDATGYGQKIGAYYLNITNPAPERIAYQALNRFKGQNGAGVKAREYLENLGYDGVNNGDEEYIAFYPEQIKSATDNVGAFDKNNPKFKYSAEDVSAPLRAELPTVANTRQRYSVAETFAQEVQDWYDEDAPEGMTFTLGSTGEVLQGLGAIESDIYMNGDKITQILNDHPEMTLEEIKRIPEILDDPVLVLKSKNTGRGSRVNTRLVIFGAVKAQNGRPVMAALDLMPTENGLVIHDLQKVNSAYARSNAGNMTVSSDVLHADKKRTIPLLRSMGLQYRPTDLLRHGSLGSITYSGTDVNIQGVPFSAVVRDAPADTVQHSFSDAEDVSAPLRAELPTVASQEREKAMRPTGPIKLRLPGGENIPQSAAEYRRLHWQDEHQQSSIVQESGDNTQKYMAESDMPGPQFMKELSRVPRDISEMVDRAVTERGGQEKIAVATATKYDNSAINKLGEPWRGKYTEMPRTISNRYIRHILEGHGNSIIEALRGQLHMTPEAIKIALSYLREGKGRVIRGTHTDHGLPSILTQIPVNGYTLYAEEPMKPDGSSELQGRTMYMTPTQPTALNRTSPYSIPQRPGGASYATPTQPTALSPAQRSGSIPQRPGGASYATPTQPTALSPAQRSGSIPQRPGGASYATPTQTTALNRTSPYSIPQRMSGASNNSISIDERIVNGILRQRDGTPVTMFYAERNGEAYTGRETYGLVMMSTDTRALDAAVKGRGQYRQANAAVRNPYIVTAEHPIITKADIKYGRIPERINEIKRLGYDSIILDYKPGDNYIVLAFDKSAVLPLDSRTPQRYSAEDVSAPLRAELPTVASREREKAMRPTGPIKLRLPGGENTPQSAAEYRRLHWQDEHQQSSIVQEGGDEKKKPVQASRPILAKKDLRTNLLNLFSVPAGRRDEIGKVIDSYADRIIAERGLTQKDRDDFFDRIYEEGVVTVDAFPELKEQRRALENAHIYVSDEVKHEFGGDWNDFRKRAFATGIYFVNDPKHQSADVWTQELAEDFPGTFDPKENDMRTMLETIVEAAESGKSEKMELDEYLSRMVGIDYLSKDEALDNLERQMDWMLRTFTEKAGLEVYLRDRTGVKIAQERARHKEMMRRQQERKELRAMQERTLKNLQWLSKNRYRAPENLKGKWDEVLGDIDLYAIGAADEMHFDKKHNMTWRDLADLYKKAGSNDPNFLPSEELKRIVARLDKDKIEDMDVDALRNLYQMAVALRTEFYNRNRLISDGETEQMLQIYDAVKEEITHAPGGYQTGVKGVASGYANDLQLTPMNYLERMAGWDPESKWYAMAKQLERGERDARHFTARAQGMLKQFEKEHRKWIRTADGRGKDAVWYELEAPECLELGLGDKPIFGDTVKVWMTPMQKVQLALEAENYDNLRHMLGGRTFADKTLYAKGKREEAFAQGRTIKLAPETVKKLAADLTEEERALYDILKEFYNDFSKKEINRVSNILYGFDKAIGGVYAPIYTNQNYVKSEPGIYDATAEGVGNLKARQVSKNPSLNISAFEAFRRSVDRTARFVGLAIPVRNMNTLMNWREKGNSMADIITHKWGKKATDAIESLLKELQEGNRTEHSPIEAVVDGTLSHYIQSVFGGNWAIVTKQFASYPLAGAYLGWKHMPLWVPGAAQVDRDLIGRYTGELDYRMMGYSSAETAALVEHPGILKQNGPVKFLLGGGAITWMDGFTVRTLWTWAKNKVDAEHRVISGPVQKTDAPDALYIGTQEQIDAGESPYYQEIARQFEEAVSRSQPMYDVMHRSSVMRKTTGATRAFTLFKTVPQQEYNMLRQAMGEAEHYKETGADKRTQREARSKVGRAFAGILIGNLMIGAVTLLNNLWKNRGRKYRDKNDEWDWDTAAEEMGKQYFKDFTSLAIGGDVFADLMSALIFGDKWYGIETPGMTQVNDILERVIRRGQGIIDIFERGADVLKNGGDFGQYLRDHSDDLLTSIDAAASTLSTYGAGIPYENVKAYLLGAIAWISPGLKTEYEDAMSKADKNGLKGLKGAALEVRLGNLMQDRIGKVDDDTIGTLAELYEAGYTKVVPSDLQGKVTIDGEEHVLTETQRQKYKSAWAAAIGDNIGKLVAAKSFKDADRDERAALLNKLYGYALEKAKGTVFTDFEASSTVERIDTAIQNGLDLAEAVSLWQGGELDYYGIWLESDARKAGVSAEDYIDFRIDTKDIKADKDASGKSISGSKKKKVLAYIDGMKLTNTQKDALYIQAGYSENEIGNAPWHKRGNISLGGSKERDDSRSATGGIMLPTGTQGTITLPGGNGTQQKPTGPLKLTLPGGESKGQRSVYSGGIMLPRA